MKYHIRLAASLFREEGNRFNQAKFEAFCKDLEDVLSSHKSPYAFVSFGDDVVITPLQPVIKVKKYYPSML